MHYGYLFLALRVVGLGIERPLVKRLGKGYDPQAITTLWVFYGEIMFVVLAAAAALRTPGYFDGITGWLPLALIPGLLYGVSFHAYVHALKIGEVSLLTPLFSTGFILMYIYDVANGWAELSWIPLSGVLLVTLGVALLNPRPAAETLTVSPDESQPAGGISWQRLNPLFLFRQPGAIAMIICAMAVATGRMVDKRLSVDAEPYLYAIVVNAPPVLIGLALLAWRRSMGELRKVVRERSAMTWLAAIIGHGAFLMYLFCLPHFPPSVIEPVSQLGVFIAVALGGLWFAEPVQARWLPSALVVLGAALLLI